MFSYAPVLRPLRPLAKIIRFQPPTNTMLTKRLRTICEVESMKAENKHLTLLVETAEGDLRSCLNTLQVSPIPILLVFVFARSLTPPLSLRTVVH
jgi:DNA polymerase III delta prime subunit